MSTATIALGTIVIGLVLLIAGGELLVRGASSLATAMRISPLVIGLTVVAFGTSAPELAVNVRAAFTGQGDLAVGNVVGSSIFNVLVVLGLSALVAPLVVSARLVQRDVPMMIVAALLLPLLGWDGRLGRGDGLMLFGLLVLYTIWTVRQGRNETIDIQQEFALRTAAEKPRSRLQLLADAGRLLIGLALLPIGSEWIVDGSVVLARLWGVSELMIGLTILAAGTSLPEVVVSIIASVRGQRDIAVGNVVGSNLLNILGVLGLTALVAPDGVPIAEPAMKLDIPVMIAVCVACLPIFFTGHRISRWEGTVFLAYYAAYIGYLIVDSTRPRFSSSYEMVMLVYVVPLTVITLAVSVFRAARRGRQA